MSATVKVGLHLIPVLARRSRQGQIGRTALMKYLYFLQAVRGINLGYHFSLYSYGPFDADVLADLGTAESLQFVSSTLVPYSGGYGYEIRPDRGAQDAESEIQEFLSKYEKDIDWLIDSFGSLTSADLELASTIVFVDQQFVRERKSASIADIAQRVKEIKPHFSDSQILQRIDALSKERILLAN